MELHKPFTSTTEQIQLLQRRGVEFTNENKAREILQREGYYSIINGYKTPFLETNTPEDKYKPGTTFTHIYELFKIDRDLRSIIFITAAKAEAMLRTTCAYCFTEQHQNEPNAYLNPTNYNPAIRTNGLLRDFNRIFENNDPSSPQQDRAKPYLQHYLEHHDGQIPLWVLTNDLTLGQMFWFFQAQTKAVRGAIAQTYTSVYNTSHHNKTEITARKLDSIYRRIKEFRNICAHDERLYCARPHDKNATIFQLIKDLSLVIGKSEYIEFLQKIKKIIKRITTKIPAHSQEILSQMGIDNKEEFLHWEEKSREPKTKKKGKEK